MIQPSNQINRLLYLPPINWNYYRFREQELTIALAKMNYECIYVNPLRYKGWEYSSLRLHETVNNEIPDNVTIIKRKSKWRKSFYTLLYENINNVILIHKYKPNIVIASDHLMSLGACIYCRVKKIKFVYDVTDDWEEVDKNKYTNFYWKNIVKPIIGRMAYYITSTSHKQTEVFKKYNNNVLTISNGKSVRFIESVKKYHSQDKVINFIGTLRDWYNFDLLFEVFKILKDFQLNIYGLGELYNELKEKTQNINNITIKGNIDYQYVPQITSESFCGILPLKPNKLNASTSPIKLFDYWAARKVVIATKTYELDMLGKDCILFANTPREFIEKIVFLYENGNIRKELENKGHNKILEKHNYEIISQKYHEIISDKP